MCVPAERPAVSGPWAALLGLALLAAVSACGDSSATVQAYAAPAAPASTNVDASKISAACFQGGTTPELQLGDGFSGADWNDPHVLKVGSQYWMYASSNLGFAPVPASPVQPYRFTSTDAVHWTLNPATPVQTVRPGQWDAGGVETPAVVYFAGMYHLFYTGYPDAWPTNSPFNFRLGHATSADGITFTGDPTPLLAPSDPTPTFYQYLLGEPGPVVFNNTLYLYFSAVGFDSGFGATLQVVGVMTTTDGTHWSAPALAFKPNQAVYPRTAYWVGYSTPNAVVIGSQVHVFVDVANDHNNNTWTQEALHHAYSADGLTGWVQDGAPLRRLTDFAWTQRELRSPGVLLDGQTLRLYFAGDDLFNTHTWGIGQMTCSLAVP